jgi:peroxiredoxin
LGIERIKYAGTKLTLILGGHSVKVLIILLLLAIMLPTIAYSGQVGSSAPDFSLSDLAGKPVSLQQFKGKVILLDFWAPWCDQCRAELPKLDDLYKQHGKDGFEIIGIGIDTSESQVTEFLQKIPITFTILIDKKNNVRKAYHFRTLPTTFIIGRDGVIRYVHLGFGNEYLQIYEKEIAELLKQQ